MTYSAFATEEEGKPREWTKHKGIAVTVDPTQPFFTAIVNETLTALNGLKTGKALLAAIAQTAPVDNRGYKVLINRVAISYQAAMEGNKQTFSARGGRSFARAAQQRLGVASDAASIEGEGVSVIMGWCQNQCMYTPKVGPQKGIAHFVPPAVTLGHELIHSYHSLIGTLKSGQQISIDGKMTSEEECYTVGLGKYSDETYTENNLRDDTNLPARLSYP